jgi:outer membrane protein assembly factor BamE
MSHSTMKRLGGCPAIAFFLLCGCQAPSLPSLPTLTPYKMDIQQGNVVTQEMVEKLKPGMTPAQVRFILGTPLVVDAFHKDRWDYVYRFSRAGTLQESRRIVIVFQDDKLAHIEGDVVAAQPGGATGGGVTIDRTVKPAGAQPVPAKPGPEIASPKPEASKAETGAAETAGSGAAGAAPASDATSAKTEKPGEEKPKEEKPKEERGFFDRMLDKLGF